MRKAFTTKFPEEPGAGGQTTAQEEDDDVDNQDLWEDFMTPDEVIRNINQLKPRLEVTRLSCFAHTLQLAVGDGLKDAKIYSVQAKAFKICTMLHSSTTFREEFDKTFGSKQGIPQINSTIWNFTLCHIKSIVTLDDNKLKNMLEDLSYNYLILSDRDYMQLRELVELLQPFLEATDMTQGDTYVTVSAVVPSVVGLYSHLAHFNATYLSGIKKALQNTLQKRFSGIFANVGLIPSPSTKEEKLTFDDILYLVATVLDPNFSSFGLRS